MKSVTFRTGSILAGLLAIGLGVAVPAQGSPILVDLGNANSFRGVTTTNPDENGNYWNSVWAGAYYPDLIDIGGNATAVDFGFSLDGGNDSYNGPAGPTSIPPTAGEIAATDIDALALGNLGAIEAAIDFYVSSRFEIQGLDPTKTYNLTFFGSHKYNNNNTTVYSVYTDNTYSTLVDSTSLLVGVNDLHNRDTVATISNIAPQTSNILYVKFLGDAGAEGYLNALQIEVVPEPAMLGMLLMGGIVMAVRRNRR